MSNKFLRDNSTLLAIVVGLFFVSGFFFQKPCQDSTTGNLTTRPWFWPCPANSDAVNSASTD